jgi:uncharacterized protein (DUF2126 family)
MRILLQHKSQYRYPTPALLGPQLVRLRPAAHAKAEIETYGLTVAPECQLRWQHDAYGNQLARLVFSKGQRVSALELLVEMAVDVRPLNPFDFFVDERCENLPFQYPAELRGELAPFLELNDPAYQTGDRFEKLLSEISQTGPTVPALVGINQRVNARVNYIIREESGVYTPEETLASGRGSCRDSAVLLVALLRRMGIAARFASGYLVQLADEGMLPDEPRGMQRDVADLHAWAEVYLVGAGWIGLDATSGLLCGEGHIPLCCSASPAAAAPLEGTADQVASDVRFELSVQRLGHEPRPTTPYTEAVWQELLVQSDRADQQLLDAKLSLTVGGEPTFNSRLHADLPEWRGEALGKTKREQGELLAKELRKRLAPNALFLERQGKWYPGESLPRWALDLIWRSNGSSVWHEQSGLRAPKSAEDAKRFAKLLAEKLDIAAGLIPAYEDVWRYLQDEAKLPTDVDPLNADLGAAEERKRLAKLLGTGLGEVAGWVLPVAKLSGRWCTSKWQVRREHLYLVQGDSPLGLRLPLASLSNADIHQPTPEEKPMTPRDPRRPKEEDDDEEATEIRTALTVETDDDALRVFLPPLESAKDFFELVAVVDAVRAETGIAARLAGYAPPSDPAVRRFSVTPDPGVLEVNLPPAKGGREFSELIETVFDAALHSGLHAEKYLLDGRMSGSGGGNHVTLGGPSVEESPFLVRPDLLASLICFVQHHPSLSYLFSGLFVGPTSQAPRVDEARHDALYELELALDRAFEPKDDDPLWLSDFLFRNLLVDLSGNTHRAEICIDKLCDPASPHGRQGLVELRAFEMPPHPRMAAAQVMLMRTLVAAFAKEPYRAPLVRWGQRLHDRFLLPHFLWQDFRDVLAFLNTRDLTLPEDAYRPFLELRCPVAGRVEADGIVIEIRNALEPWPVSGEVASQTGTSRYVDSSVERIEVRASGITEGRHQLAVNRCALPMHPTGVAGQGVAGVRFRAWAPPQSLQPHLGIHHPLRVEVLDLWGQRSLLAATYHVWHAEGRAFNAEPLTRFEAQARRAQRFTRDGLSPWPVDVLPTSPHPEAPMTLDLRRYPVDHPMPEEDADEADEDAGT